MNKKLIITIIIIVLILIAGIGIYFVLQEPKGKCRDSVCGPVEKEKGICQEDCG